MNYIQPSKIYVVESIPGVSGFQRWNEREYYLLSGATLRTKRGSFECWKVFEVGDGTERWELDDGHLPGFRPVVRTSEVIEWVTIPGNVARLVMAPLR